METKYDRKKHNRTYYEKNSENIKRKQREKRAKMKAALQQLESSMLGGIAQLDPELRWSSLENQKTDNDEPVPEPESRSNIFNISENVKGLLFKAAISGSLVASQAVYRALRKTIENRQSTTQSSQVISSNPLD